MKLLLVFALMAVSSYAEVCSYTYSGEKQELTFTGYKFTEKTGVSGTFKNFKIIAPSSSSSIEELFSNASFWIDEMTLDAGNAARNSNIGKSLLKNVSGLSIRGHVEKVNKKKGTLISNINWGGKNHKVEMKYGILKNMAFVEGTIDLLEMGFTKAFNELSKTCQTLHKGKDGKSKTWSDVAIRASLVVDKKCN